MGLGLAGVGGVGVYGGLWEFPAGGKVVQGGSGEREEETLAGVAVKCGRGSRELLPVLA